jgi:hypothetical protein
MLLLMNLLLILHLDLLLWMMLHSQQPLMLPLLLLMGGGWLRVHRYLLLLQPRPRWGLRRLLLLM